VRCRSQVRVALLALDLAVVRADAAARGCGNGMVRYEQLPGWQEKSPSRLPDLNAADSVPKVQKQNGKAAILECG
jgi:hypothetical protein